MTAHSHHLPETFRNLAPWELGADALAAIPEPTAPVSDASGLHTAAETLAAYWTAQADVLRYGATLHSLAAQARQDYENAGSVYDAYECAVRAAETAAGIARNLKDAATRMTEAAATAISGIPVVEPLNGAAEREYERRTAASWQVDASE